MSSTESKDKQNSILSVDNMTPITIMSKEKTSFHTLSISIGEKLDIIYFINIDIINKISPVIMGCIENSDDNGNPLPLSNIEDSEFRLLMEYVERANEYEISNGAEKDISSNTKTLNEWELKIFNHPTELIFKLMLAANFLNYSNLLDRTGMYIASIIQKSGPSEVKKMFQGELADVEKEPPIAAAAPV